ncbi:hypothetical protein K435DRAFT_809384, partial [Dendrothele bispora CBS 962.96]
VTSYADPFVLTTGSWTIYVSSLFDYLIVITVQMFFAKMIFQLLKGFRKWLLVVGLMMFIVSEFGFFRNSDHKNWDGKLLESRRLIRNKLGWIVKDSKISIHIDCESINMGLKTSRSAPHSANAIRCSDDSIPLLDSVRCESSFQAVYETSSDNYYLRNKPFHFDDNLISREFSLRIVGSVQTIVMIANPHNRAILSVDYLSAHLYINSLLAALNARDRVRAIGMGAASYVSSGEVNPTRANTVNLPGMQSSAAPPFDSTNPGYNHSMGEHNRQPSRKGVHISVETESYVMKDFDSESPEPVHNKGREETVVV